MSSDETFFFKRNGFDKYQKEGYKSVANYFLKQNIVLSIPRFIKYQILKK